MSPWRVRLICPARSSVLHPPCHPVARASTSTDEDNSAVDEYVGRMEMMLMPFDTLRIARATCSPARRSPPARTTRGTPDRAESSDAQ